MRILFPISAAAFLLSSCAPAAIIYDGSRKGTVSVIERVVVHTHPAVEANAAAECVIQGMTYGEVLKIGTGNTTKVSQQSYDLITEVSGRPKTAECLASLPEVTAG